MRPVRDCSERPSAETTPAVTVASKPSGLPMAMAIWPRLSFELSPSRAAGSVTFSSTRSSARSVSGSSPSTRACNSRPSSVVSATAARALHDVAVGQRQAVGRDDDARAGAGALAVAANVDAHDAGADADRRRR